MTDFDVPTGHMRPARAAAARDAREVLVDAAATWANAPKQQVGALLLPAGRAAAHAFDAFFAARRELAHHTGGRTAALVADEALAAEYGKTDA